MKIVDLINILKKYPKDSDVVLSKLIAIDASDGGYDVILDNPIIGAALNESDKEVRLILGYGSEDTNVKFNEQFGTIIKFK